MNLNKFNACKIGMSTQESERQEQPQQFDYDFIDFAQNDEATFCGTNKIRCSCNCKRFPPSTATSHSFFAMAIFPSIFILPSIAFMALLLFGSSPVGHSETFKVIIKGYVVCVQTNKYFQMDPLYHASGYEYAMHDGARVILWEYDFLKDDKMDETTTGDNGRFLLEGSQSEYGSIEPFLEVFHKCPSPFAVYKNCKHFKLRVPLPPATDSTNPTEHKLVIHVGSGNLGEPIECD